MELCTTAGRRGTAWPIFLPGGWATTRRAIVAVAAATLIGTTLAPSAQGKQEEVRDAVEPDSGLGFMAVLPGGDSVQVYPCARNRATDAIKEHCYLYLPPLTVERDSDGRVLASETPSGGVRVRVRGVSQHLTNGVHAWLAAEDMLPDAKRPGSVFVGPLPYHQIRITDADYALDVRWAAVYPDADVTPVPQEWITFVFTPRDGVSESPAKFIERLNDPGRLPSLSAVLGYSGRTVVIASLTLKASDLKQTNFLLDLKGKGGRRDLVTRDQRHELTSRAATYVTQRRYKEGGPDDVDVKLDVKLDGLLVLFKEIRMSGQELWSSAENLLRVGFSGDDLLPDRHRQIWVETAKELLDETDTHFSKVVSDYWRRGESKMSGSYEGGVSLLGSVKASFSRTAPRDDGGEAERLEKAEFLKRLESENSLFRWDGEIIVPKNIVLYQLDEAQLDTDTELASIEVKTTRATASLGYTIYNAPPSLRIPFCYPTCAGADLTGADLTRADLRDADLRGADLRDADLRGADLTDADLRAANLTRSNLSRRDAGLRDMVLHGANLTGAKLHGAKLHGANLVDADLTGADLRGADLRGVDLRGANLHAANLVDADLTDANLSYANLINATLKRTKLHGAKLHGANLTGADLRTATLSGTDSTRAGLGGADLRGVDLRGANLHAANLVDADLTDANLSHANLINATLIRTKLHGADLSSTDSTRADLRGADLRDANLRDANLRDANLRDANLERADLSGAQLSHAKLAFATLKNAKLNAANLRVADLRVADLRGADLCGADLRGADLRVADLRGADLRGADLCGADLRGANRIGTDLRGADLRGADLRGAKWIGTDLRVADLRGAQRSPFFCSGSCSGTPVDGSGNFDLR